MPSIVFLQWNFDMPIFREPEIIILDEPSAAYDPYRTFQFQVRWDGASSDAGDSHDSYANLETNYLMASDVDLIG